MALYTKKEFADICGLPTKNLSTYIGRGKVIVRDDGMIDDAEGINNLFFSKRGAKAPRASAVKK